MRGDGVSALPVRLPGGEDAATERGINPTGVHNGKAEGRVGVFLLIEVVDKLGERRLRCLLYTSIA